MASPTATKRPTATLTAWPTRCKAAWVRSDFLGLSLWLISVVICRETSVCHELHQELTVNCSADEPPRFSGQLALQMVQTCRREL